MKTVLISLVLSCLSIVIIAQDLAPDFAYLDIEGNTSTLADLNGEVTYISFWASWCKPCLNNFKKYEEMRCELQDKGVILLNVNIDDDKNVWTSTVQSQKIVGTNVWSSDFEKLQDDYEVLSLPQYEIVNKQGYLVYLSEDPNRSIIQEFVKWIKD